MLSWLTVFMLAGTSVAAETEAEPAPSTEVVRIKRDFGKAHFDLAIDAWQASATRLEKVQLLWVNTSEADRRKPLGRLIERMVSLKYKRVSGRSIKVVVAGDDKEFTFTVEIGHDGALHTYVAVDTDGGHHIPRCRTDSSKLLARRVLGIPVGISKVAVSCRDADGNLHSGQVRHKAV
jgi:hypothetical protein